MRHSSKPTYPAIMLSSAVVTQDGRRGFVLAMDWMGESVCSVAFGKVCETIPTRLLTVAS
jgi:hypothetical protein